MRKLLIAANWKMYKTPTEAQSFLHTFLPLVKDETKSEIVICPPAVDLATAVHSVKGSDVLVGAQNMHFAEEGAFTGEISRLYACRPGREPRDPGPLRAAAIFWRDATMTSTASWSPPSNITWCRLFASESARNNGRAA